MTIDEAIEHCIEIANKKYADPNDEELDRCIECANQHEQLKEWLEELKILRKANEWIPVEERLPNKEGLYLVTCKPYDDTKVIVITSYFYGYGEVCQGYREFPEGIWEANQIGDVLAWMPLPEPYEKE